MVDQSIQTKKSRAIIDALRVLNALRAAKGLPTVRKPRKVGESVKLTRHEKQKLCRNIWAELFPQAVTENEYVLPEHAVNAVLREFTRRQR